MKQKALSVLVVTVVLGILLVGLTGAEETMQETETFKFMVPDKWEFTVFQNGAVQIYNRMGTSMVELKKEGLYRTHGRSQNLYRPGWRGA